MYTQELEQEKYHLRRRLEVAEEEYELKVSELHSDITVSLCFLDNSWVIENALMKMISKCRNRTAISWCGFG